MLKTKEKIKEHYDVWCPHCNKFYDVTDYVNDLLNEKDEKFQDALKKLEEEINSILDYSEIGYRNHEQRLDGIRKDLRKLKNKIKERK